MASANDSQSKSATETPVEVSGDRAKRKYSKGAKGILVLERAVSKSMEQISEGLTRTLQVYNKKSDKSSRKKRDGAFRDGLQNWAAAMSKGASTASEAPEILMKAVNKGPGGKSLRKIALSFVPPQLR